MHNRPSKYGINYSDVGCMWNIGCVRKNVHCGGQRLAYV